MLWLQYSSPFLVKGQQELSLSVELQTTLMLILNVIHQIGIVKSAHKRVQHHPWLKNEPHIFEC